jgi:hypothetical protein
VTGWFSGAPFPSSRAAARQRARVHDGARQDVRAGLGALLQHHHRDLLACARELLQADRGRQAGRAAADHDHVVFHGFARAELGQDFFVRHVGLVGR